MKVDDDYTSTVNTEYPPNCTYYWENGSQEKAYYINYNSTRVKSKNNLKGKLLICTISECKIFLKNEDSKVTESVIFSKN